MTDRAHTHGTPSHDVEAWPGLRDEMTEGGNRRIDDPSAWLIVRRDGTVVAAERRACELLGAPDPDALAGRECASLIASPEPEAQAVLRAVAAGGEWEGQLLFRYARREVALAVSVGPVGRSSDLMVMGLRRPDSTDQPSTGTRTRTGGEEARAGLASIERPLTPEPDDLRALIAAQDALHDLSEPSAVARSVLQALQAALPFDWAVVLRFEGEASEPARVEVVATYPTPMAGVSQGASWSPPDPDEALVRSTGEPSMQGVLLPGAASASPLRRLPAFGLRSRILIPLFAGQDVAGALALFRTGPLAFTAAEGIVAERTVRRLGEGLRPAPDAARSVEPGTTATTPPHTEPAPPPAMPDPPRPPDWLASAPEASTAATDASAPPAAPAPPPSTLPPPEASLVHSRLESLSEVVAGVAHELNNPLTAILGYAQILGGLEGTEREHALRTIEDEAQRAARIVRNLLSFARQRPGQRHLVNIEEVLRRVIDLRRYALEVDDVHVATRLALVPEVLVDEGQFEQVFLNLLNNAQQALQGRGGEVTITTWRGGDRVYVSFADDGPGVPPHLRARVFEPFFTTREVGHGQGMGLAIVYGVVTNHGGRAWVEDNAAGGATFVVEVPLPEAGGGGRRIAGGAGAPAHEATRNGSTPVASPGSVEQPSGGRVLVVDDEVSVLALTREILSSTGFEVETADGGEAALRLLERHHFDAVVTDLRMPGMDGATLYRRVGERWPELASRFLFVTGDIEGEPNGATLDRSSVRYLEKPFTTRQLLNALQEVIASASRVQG